MPEARTNIISNAKYELRIAPTLLRGRGGLQILPEEFRIPRSAFRVPRFIICLSLLLCILVSSATGKTLPQDELESVLTAGRAALEDGLYELAQRKFERYLKKANGSLKDNEEAVVLLARALYEQQKYAEILDFLKARKGWMKKAPDSAAFSFWCALAQYELGKFDKVLAELSGFEKKYPHNEYAGRVKRLRAWCCLKAGKTNQALEEFAGFDKTHGDSPEMPANLLDWAQALVTAGRPDSAHQILAKLVKLPADLEAVQRGHHLLGQTLIQEKKWKNAAGVLTSLAENNHAKDDLRAEARFSLAVIYEAQLNRDKAVSALNQGIEQARSPELKQKGSLNLGRLLLDTGRLDEGIPLLKTFISMSPNDPAAGIAQLKLAESLLNNGRHQQAVDEFQHYLETFTNRTGQAKAYHGKGWGFFNIGRYAEAATTFGKAYDLFTDSSMKEQCLFKVGDAYFANGQYSLASESYERIASEFPESKLVPNALFQIGESMTRAGKAGKGEEKFLELVRKYPESPFAEEALLRIAEIKVGIAESKEAQGSWVEATKVFNEAIECFNRVMNVYSNGDFYAEALHGRGEVYYRFYRSRRALDDFERIVNEFPESKVFEQAYYKQGMCYYRMVRDKEALSIWTEFVKRFPESNWAPKVLFEIGKYEYNQGNYEVAQSNLVRFAVKYPDNALADDSLLWAGLAAARRNEYLDSIELFTRLVKEYPKSRRLAEARFSQSDALLQLGKYSEAILICDEIINKYPDSDLIAPAWARKGDCQFMLGAEDSRRYEEAISSYRVVANDSNVGRDHRDLMFEAEYKTGRCQEKLGRIQKALGQYYEKVMIRFLADRENGLWHNEASKIWFGRASLNAADIMEAKKEWRKAVKILERVVSAGVPDAVEARARIKKIKSKYWWLFY